MIVVAYNSIQHCTVAKVVRSTSCDIKARESRIAKACASWKQESFDRDVVRGTNLLWRVAAHDHTRSGNKVTKPSGWFRSSARPAIDTCWLKAVGQLWSQTHLACSLLCPELLLPVLGLVWCSLAAVNQVHIQQRLLCSGDLITGNSFRTP